MATNTTSPCTIQGNPDLLGLGLRLTFYLQPITASLAGAFLDQQFDYLQSSGIVFFLAMLGALVREVENATIRAPEAAVVFWLLYLQALALGTASRVRSLAHEREAVRKALMCAALIYGCWFWYRGIDRLPRTEGCEEYAFYIRRTELRGEYLRTQKVVFPLSSVFWGGWCGWSVYKFVRAKSHGRDTSSGETTALAETINDSREKLKNSPRLVKVIVYAFTIGIVMAVAAISLCITVPAIELMIQWNDIQGVQRLESVGQLAPFLLAVGMLAHVLYSIFRGKDSFREEWEREREKKSGDQILECPKQTLRAEQHELLERDSRYVPNVL